MEPANEPARNQLRPLNELFPDPEELDLATKLVDAVPEDAVHSPFLNASISGIIFTAFPDKSDAERSTIRALVVNHRILDILAYEGYVRHSGNCSGWGYNPLYEQP